ncbi:hypothetical protein BGW38_008946 [Lunasporangiospora selenospora]|uniref:Amino acid transporter transmembrane domain-containing protein n=1 Tax=Lunasporangiospora selenospora TaxID=979761 RepID=A0A9P6FXF5_9FUNG|nr:hypothetical protein BGW38_008946 [Lunasporangiospora selenospora]
MISVMTLPPILAIVALRGFHYAPDHKRSYDFVGDNVFPAIGVMAFAMLSAQTAFLNFTTLAQPTRKAWGQATGIAVFFSWIISFVFAIIGFIAFGEDVQPNIFNSFPSTDDLINIGRILLGFSMFLTVPQAFYPARASLHKVLGHEDNFKSPTDTEHVYTTIGLFFPILACGVFVADLGLLYQLIGGFCSTFLAYIIPGACYIIVFWSKDGGQSLRERIRQEQAQWEQKSEGLGISPSSSNGSLTNASYSGTVLEQGQDRFEDSSEEEEGASVTFDNDDEEEDQAFLRKKLAAERQHDPAHAEHGISTQKQRQGKARSPPIGYNPKDSTTEPLLKDNRLSGSYGALSSLPNSPSSTSSASSAGSNTISPISGQGSSRRKTELWLDVSAVVLLVFGTFVMVVATTITLRRMLGYS